MLPGSVLALCVEERFWALACSASLRLLDRLYSGTPEPTMSTTTTIPININVDRLEAGFGATTGAAVGGPSAASDGESARVAGAAAAGLGSTWGGLLAGSAGEAAAAGF